MAEINIIGGVFTTFNGVAQYGPYRDVIITPITPNTNDKEEAIRYLVRTKFVPAGIVADSFTITAKIPKFENGKIVDYVKKTFRPE